MKSIRPDLHASPLGKGLRAGCAGQRHRAAGTGWLARIFLLLLAFLVQAPVLAREAEDIQLPNLPAHQLETARDAPRGWKVAHTDRLEIQYPASERATANQFMRDGDAQVDDLAAIMEIKPQRKYVVRLAGDKETFQRVQPSRAPVWAAGTAYPTLGIMVLKTRRALGLAGQESLYKTFKHEVVHLLLGGLEKPIPFWLNEGLARFVASEVSVREWTLLSQAVLVDGLIPFADLEENFPLGGSRAELAYAQSREFLVYLSRRFGHETIHGLLRSLGKGKSFDDALWSETLLNLNSLEEDWHTELNHSYVWVAALMGGMSLWGMTALLLVVAYLRRRYKSKVRRARWEEEEAVAYGEKAHPRASIQVPQFARFRLLRGGRMAQAPFDESAPPELEYPGFMGMMEDDEDEDDDEDDEFFEAILQRPRSASLVWGDSDTPDDDEDPEEVPPGGWIH